MRETKKRRRTRHFVSSKVLLTLTKSRHRLKRTWTERVTGHVVRTRPELGCWAMIATVSKQGPVKSQITLMMQY